MGKRDRHDLATAINRRTFTCIWTTAAFSFVVLVFWIFGIPGVQNAYAIGWRLGLKTLFHYVLGCFLLLIIYMIVAKMTHKFYRLRYLNLMIASCFWIFFLYSAFNIYRAFQIMVSAVN